MNDEPAPQESEAPQPPPQTGRLSLPASLPAIAGATLGTLLVLVIIAVAIKSFITTQRSGIPLEITRVSQTSPLQPPTSPPVVEIGNSQVALSVPISLEVRGQTFDVSTSAPGEEDVLANVAPTEGEASWVYGTVINYVVGLEPPSDGLDIADEIRPGDMIVLLLSNGGQLTFRASSLLDPPVDDAIFSQFRPGLTMVVLEEGTPSVVVTASFDTATEPDTGSAASIAVGQPVSIGDVRVVVLEGHSERTGSAQPPGTVTFLVEFSLTNLGSSALNTERFLMNLQDAAGNQYLQSPTATAHGRSGALPGSIQPGAQVGASAGYTIPETVPGPSLTWIFGPDPTSTERATIIVPYAPEVAVSTPPDVEVTQAFLAEGQSTLHIVAQIRNPGNTTVSVTASDVSLSSSGGPGELQVAAPPFPWTIEGGDTREVELQFARPAASTAAVTILGFTFEIGGLP